MSKLTAAVRNFVRNEEGATTAEYGIIVVVMAAIALIVMTSLQGSLNDLYSGAQTNINKATTFGQ